MSIDLNIYVEDIDEVMDSWATILVYRASTPDGTFSSLAATIPLVADQRDYTATDTAGTTLSWYRYLFSGGVGADSGLSPAWQPDSSRLDSIRFEANRLGADGWASTCSGNGTTSSLVDAVLRDSGVDSSFAEGAWLYRPDAAAGDKLRRVGEAGFTTASGAFTPTRNWTVAPTSGEAYQVFKYLPPYRVAGADYSWDDCVREGINVLQFPDLLILNAANNNSIQQLFDLTEFSGYLSEDRIRSVFKRTTINGYDFYQDANKLGGYTEFIENGPGNLTLKVVPAPLPSETLVVDFLREYIRPYGPSDPTDCPFDLAVRAAIWRCFWHLNNRRRPGKYAVEQQGAWGDLEVEAARYHTTLTVYGA